ncbi:MAG: fasciclin domain-containing protein, partial [Bacteroidota bacterium]
SFFDANDNFDDLDDFTDQELEELMRYHIIPGNVRQAEMQNQLAPTTFPTLLEGDSVIVRQGFDWQVDDAVFLIQDIQSTNGVMHIINNVLIPG